MVGRIRERLSYANVMATAALFVALGGTSYALTLPRNSVGSAQLRGDSVGRSELRRGAVSSSAIKNRSVRLKDISGSARADLRGQPGPPGPQGPSGVTFRASVDAIGSLLRGNAKSSNPAGYGGRLVGFEKPVHVCVSTATLSPSGQPPGRITVEPSADGRVLVRTYNASGAAAPLPFNLIVAC